MTHRARFGMILAAGFLVAVAVCCGGGGGSDSGFTAPPPDGPPAPPPPPAPGAPANFASRTSGIAPLAVFFDAVNTASPAFDSGVVQPSTADYGSFQYAWDFGDPGSGTWATDGRFRNIDTGFTAAHVYESPGTYTATLTVTDAAGDPHVYSQDITVSDFTGTTYYISNGGNDNNDGLSPSTPWATFGKVMNNLDSDRRFLFERGGTFTTSAPMELSMPGPGIVGAYGSGDRPIIQATGSNGAFRISNADWRIQDLEIVGGPGSTSMGVTFVFHIQTRRMLLYRCEVRNFWVNIGWFDFDDIYLTPHEENVIADCEVSNGQDYCAFVGGRRIAVIGNSMDTVTVAGHILRMWMCDKGVVGHNYLANPVQHAFKLHGAPESTTQPKTRFVSVFDNRMVGGTWMAAVGPQDAFSDERITQVVFERNWLQANTDTSIGLVIWARDVTIRNNVFLGTGSANWGYDGVVVERRGIEPAATRVQILNNTVFKGDSGSDFSAFSVASNVSNVTIRNNLASAPNASGVLLLTGSCPGLVSENNLLTSSPGFTNAGSEDFTLTSGSAARNTGQTLLEVKNDYTFTTLRPQGAAFDLGAYERD